MGILDSARESASNRPAPEPSEAPRRGGPAVRREAVETRTTRLQDQRDGIGRNDRLRFEQEQRRAPVAAQQDYDRFNEDLTALQEGNPDKVRDWKNIASYVVQMTENVGEGDEGYEDVASLRNALMWQYGDEIRPNLDAIGGEGWWDEHYTEMPEEDRGVLGTVLQGVGRAGEVLDYWGSNTRGIVTGLAAAIDQRDEVGIMDGLAHAGKSAGSWVVPQRATGFDPQILTTSDGRRLSADQDGDGDVGIREAFGADPQWGGFGGDVFEAMGQVLLDPTTYLGVGLVGKAGLGIKGITRVADDVFEAAARTGFKSLTREQAGQVRQIPELVRRGGVKSLDEGQSEVLDRLLRTFVEASKSGRKVIDNPRALDDLVATQRRVLERGGREGVHFAGRTIVPTARLSDALAGLGVSSRVLLRPGRQAAGEALSEGAEAVAKADFLADDLPFEIRVSLDEAGEPSYINVYGMPKGDVELSRSMAEVILSQKSELELANLVRQEPDVAALLPPGPSTDRVVKLSKDQELWQYGMEGVAHTYDELGRGQQALDFDATPRRTMADMEEEFRQIPNTLRRQDTERTLALLDRMPEYAGNYLRRNPMVSPESLRTWVKNIDETGSATRWNVPETVAQTPAEWKSAQPLSEQMELGLEFAAKEAELDEYGPYLTDVVSRLDEDAAKLLEGWDEALDNITSELFELGRTKGVLARMAEHPRLGVLVRAAAALKPRLLLQSVEGRRVANEVGHALSVTRDSWRKNAEELGHRLGTDGHANGLLRRAISDSGLTEERVWREVDAALADPRTFAEALERTDWPEAMHTLIKSAVDVRNELYESTLRGMGFTPEEVGRIMLMGTEEAAGVGLHARDTYVPRVLTGKTMQNRQLMDEMTNMDSSLIPRPEGNQALHSGALNRRTLAQDTDSVFEANDVMARQLKEAGVSDVPDVLIDRNIPAALVRRSEAAFRAEADIQLLNQLSRIMDDAGTRAMAYRIPAEELQGLVSTPKAWLDAQGLSAAKYRVIETPSGTSYAVDNAVARELEDVRRIVGDQREMGAFADFANTMQQLWATGATVSWINPGFTIRNALGNLFNMFLGGARNPQLLVRSGKLQDLNKQITDVIRRDGVSWADAAKTIDDLDPEALFVLKNAREMGVIGDNRTLDLLRGPGSASAAAGDTPSLPSVGSHLSPTSDRSIINRPGRWLGSRVEDNARLGMFLDQLDKGANPADAAQHVKRYLFDYGDLTRFEAEKIRTISRFYTFTRKNLGVQAYAAGTIPFQQFRAQQASQAFVKALTEPTDPNAEGADSPLPDFMEGGLLRSTNGQNLAVNIDTPLNSALDTAGIAVSFIDWMAGNDSPLEPEGARRREFFDKLNGLLAGAPVSILTAIEEERLGIDSFTGRPLDPDKYGPRDRTFWNLASAIYPAVSRIGRHGDDLQQWDYDGKDPRNWAAAMLNVFGGLQVYELNDDSDSGNRSAILAELQELMDEMREDRGAYDPVSNPEGIMTNTQLREAGELGIRDRMMEALLWSYRQDPTTGDLVWQSSDEVRQGLLDFVPKDVLAAFGVDTEGHDFKGEQGEKLDADDTEGWNARNERNLATAIEAFESWRGEPLTEQEKVDFVISSGWGPNSSMLEDLGLEPYRGGNRFLADEEGPSYEDQVTGAEERLRALAEVAGLDPEAFAEYRPRLSDFERVLQEAAAAGVGREDLIQFITHGTDEGGGGVLSRNDRAFMNQILGFGRTDGPVPLSTTRDIEVEDEDIRKIRVRAWQQQQELLLFFQLYDLPAPTQDQIHEYVVNSLLTSGSLDDLGLNDLKGAPNRKDTRTEGEQQEDSESYYSGILQGLDTGPVTPFG